MVGEVKHITDYYEWTLVCHKCGETEGWSVVLNEEELIKDGHRLDAGFVIDGDPILLKYIRGVRCLRCHNLIPIKERKEDV